MKTQEQLEFAISQYHDGTLPLLERAAVEARLKSDPAARAILDEYRALDGLLISAIPAVTFDEARFHEALRQRLANMPTPHRGIIGRIAPVMRIALAACVAAAVTLWVYKPDATTNIEVAPPQQVASTLRVEGPRAEKPAGAPVIQIAIRPAPSLEGYAFHQSPAREALIQRPATIMIASSERPTEDMGAFSF